MASEKLTNKLFLKNILQCRKSNGASIKDFDFNKTRVRVLSKVEEVKENSNGILYWMCRDCRVQDNWAMLFAQRLALKQALPLYVCFFCADCKDLYPTRRQFKFLIDGLQHVQKECKALGIKFYLINSSPTNIAKITKDNNIGCVVTDFFPLKKPQEWKEENVKNLPDDVPLVEVDAHNIVPCWVASPKQEIAARTIRSKINKKLDEYLTGFPPLTSHPHSGKLTIDDIVEDFGTRINDFRPDNVKEVKWAQPGPEDGLETLRSFMLNRLKLYGECSNDPSKDAVSNLSPWIHFGQISTQRCALEINKFKQHKNQSEKFLEELIIRKEICDNYCFYNSNYDNLEGADAWAKKTLNEHRSDKRVYLYTREQFEKGETHDDIWNCAQFQLVQDGKIHGYMRMYWCKKILEWTETPERAIEIALYLNDTFSLDGSDPNGFVGVMWSICGIHDHGWKERDIFGKIRFMVDYSLRKKVDVDAYCARYGRTLAGGDKNARKRKAPKK